MISVREPAGASIQQLSLLVSLDEQGRIALRSAFLMASSKSHDWVYRSHFFLGLVSQDFFKQICADHGVEHEPLVDRFDRLLPPAAHKRFEAPVGSPELAAALNTVGRAFSMHHEVSAAALFEHFLRVDHEFRDTIGRENLALFRRPRGDQLEIPNGDILAVRLFNDDVTTQEFVAACLERVAALDGVQARRKMLEIDTTGSSAVFAGPRSEAIRVAQSIIDEARLRGFPLVARLEASKLI